MTTNCAVASPCAYGTGTALIFCVVPSFEIAHDTARAQSGMCKSRQNRVTTRLTSGYTVPARTGRPVDVRRCHHCHSPAIHDVIPTYIQTCGFGCDDPGRPSRYLGVRI